MRPRRSVIGLSAALLMAVPALHAQTASTQPAGKSSPPAATSPSAPPSTQADALATQPGDEKIPVGETVVTADRVVTSLERTGSSVSIITADEIQRKQITSVADALRQVPGVEVERSGGIGQETSVFIRGANAAHTLVLIDGVEANDPSSPERAFDFAHLTTDNVERIEVIRGPQSLVWGSDAMGGVINIITKKGDGKPTFTLTAEGGSFGMYRESGAASGGDHLFNYSVGFSRFDNAGISAAASSDGNSERDGYHATNINAHLGFTPADEYDVTMTLRHTDAWVGIDKDGGKPGAFTGDQSNRYVDTEETYFRVAPRFFLLDGAWESTFGVAVTQVNHTDTDGFVKDNQGRTIKIDWLNTFRVIDNNTLTVGVETESEMYDDSTTRGAEARNDAMFLNDQMTFFDCLTLGAGGRVDNHEAFGVHPTYRFTAAYANKETKTTLRASYGTGFKAPSLFELFGGYTSPTTRLLPEKSRGWDAGIEQVVIKDRLSFGATYFANNFEDLIDFGPSFTYLNVGAAKTSGVETFIAIKPIDTVNVRLGYTYTDTEDKSGGANDGKQLLRRAPHKFSVDTDWQATKDLRMSLGLTYVSRRDDIDPSAFYARTREKGYTYMSLAGSYALTKNVTVFGRVENMLDEQYEEVKGFGTPGVSAFGGVRLTF